MKTLSPPASKPWYREPWPWFLISQPATAVVAGIAIFAPSFVFVALLERIVPWMRARPTAKAFLTGVTTASLGLMAGVLVQLTDAAISDILTAAIAVAALAVLIGTKVNSAWLVAAGVAIGALGAAASYGIDKAFGLSPTTEAGPLKSFDASLEGRNFEWGNFGRSLGSELTKSAARQAITIAVNKDGKPAMLNFQL